MSKLRHGQGQKSSKRALGKEKTFSKVGSGKRFGTERGSVWLKIKFVSLCVGEEGSSAPQRGVWRYKQGRKIVKEFVLYPKSNGISEGF